MTYIYEMGQRAPVGYIEDFYSSGSSNRMVVSNVRYKWTCHYCGSPVNPELDQCPKCGGEKRSQSASYPGNSRVQYVQDETFNVNMNITTPPKGVWGKIKMAMGVRE